LTARVSSGIMGQQHREVGEVADVTDGTSEGLQQFLTWAGGRGEINPSTAGSLSVAVRAVLAVEPDPDRVDVREINVEDVLDRFETLNRTGYTTQSMQVYKSRFRRAVSMYVAWLEKRSDWKNVGGRSRATKTAGAGSGSNNSKRVGSKSTQARAAAAPAPAAPHRDGEPTSDVTPMVPYDLPLRPGLRVRLVLPEALTKADATRIAAFVNSLAFADQSPPAGAENGNREEGR
jgi:hypothetical protein